MAQSKESEPGETKPGPKARLYQQCGSVQPLGLLIYLSQQDERTQTNSQSKYNRSGPFFHRENINYIRLLLFHRDSYLCTYGIS